MSSKSVSFQEPHRYQDLIEIFNQTFFEPHNTRLVLGGAEPVYLPANAVTSFHQIVFAHGFYSSALHEIAHWCIAGEQRRLQTDYGYWYAPDGRNAKQQAEFEWVEVKPQAIECILSSACKKSFRVSVDNLSDEKIDATHFLHKVTEQVKRYDSQGLPMRAEMFRQALLRFYGEEQLFSNGL